MSKRQWTILDSVRDKIRPTKSEAQYLKRSEEEVRAKLAMHMPKDVEIGLMGSVAKGTALHNNRDLDIFLLFSKKYNPDEVKKKGIEWAKKAMRGYKTELNYAQHPYLKVKMPNLKVDIVPSFKISNNEKIKTAVDRSQLHTIWVNQKINDNMRDDVRLLKQFLGVLGVYGAQSRIEGFSGYLCELLIIKYGSFENLLNEASKWSNPIIDIENFYSNEQASKMFEKSAMVVIDPTDKNRNVSAVVSQTSLSRFILAARRFLQNPSAKFFFAKKKNVTKKQIFSSLKRRGTHIIILKFRPPKLVEDVLWPQIKKSANAIISKLKEDDFRVFGHYFYADEEDAFILLELMDWKLPRIKHVLGPNVTLDTHVEIFMQKHKTAENLHAEHSRVVAIEKRERVEPLQTIKWAIKNSQKVGIPIKFAKVLAKSEYKSPNWLATTPKLRAIAADYLLRKL